MFLLILASTALLVIIALFKIKIANKLMILTSIVIVLILINLINELGANIRSYMLFEQLNKGTKYEFSKQLYKQSLNKTLFKQQQRVLDYLLQRIKVHENILVHIKNLNSERFRIIFQEFQKQTNCYSIEFDLSESKQLDLFNLKKLIKHHKQKEKTIVLIFQNPSTFQHLTYIKNLYLKHNVSIILKNIPHNFQLHTVYKYTEIITIEPNYFINQLFKSHSPKLVSLCNKYATIDYDFYIHAQNIPLNELCSQNLPSNEITNCIRSYMSDQDSFVAYTRVKHCFPKSKDINEDMKIIPDGIIYSNGQVKVAKEYYWSGKVDKKQFMNVDNQL